MQAQLDHGSGVRLHSTGAIAPWIVQHEGWLVTHHELCGMTACKRPRRMPYDGMCDAAKVNNPERCRGKCNAHFKVLLH